MDPTGKSNGATPSDFTFDPQAWQQFDFKQWHADGIPGVSAASAALGAFAQKLVATPDWRQTVAATVPQLHAQALAAIDQQAQTLATRADDVAKAMTARADRLKTQGLALTEQLVRNTAPPAASKDPGGYGVAVKAVAAGNGTGHAGLVVRLIDPRDPDRVLAEGVTDADGHAVLVLREGVKELERAKTPLTVEVRTPGGTSLLRHVLATAPKLNQTATYTAELVASGELEPHASAGRRRRATLEARIAALDAMVHRLADDREALLDRLHRRAQSMKPIDWGE